MLDLVKIYMYTYIVYHGVHVINQFCLQELVLKQGSVNTTSPMDASSAKVVNSFTAPLKNWPTRWLAVTL